MITTIKYILAFFILLLTQAILSKETVKKVIYGNDDRVEIYDAPGVWQDLARSTVSIIRSDQIIESAKENHYELIGPTFGEKQKLCTDEPYRSQKMIAQCSAFLVSSDIVATAGHCIRDEKHCKTLAYVFDVDKKEGEQESYDVHKDKFYSCKKLVEHVNQDGLDYALIRLNKPVKDRIPLVIRKQGKPKMEDEMAIIGHPYGVLKKFSDNGFIINNSEKQYFSVDLDSYTYNSGSPVFNVNTEEVEGILVRGQEDFVYDENFECFRSRVCDALECRGEDVLRITNIILN